MSIHKACDVPARDSENAIERANFDAIGGDDQKDAPLCPGSDRQAGPTQGGLERFPSIAGSPGGFDGGAGVRIRDAFPFQLLPTSRRRGRSRSLGRRERVQRPGDVPAPARNQRLAQGDVVTSTRQLLSPVELDFPRQPFEPQSNPAIAHRRAIKIPVSKNDMGVHAPPPVGGSFPVNDEAVRVGFGVDANFLQKAVGVGTQFRHCAFPGGGNGDMVQSR